MPFAYWAAVVASTLYRLSVYTFLRVIPASYLTYILPSLYLSYIFATLFISTSESPPPTSRPKEKHPSDPSKATTDERPVTVPPRATLWDVLLSCQSTWNAKIVTFFINTLLLAAAIDVVIEPYFDRASDVTFTRVGAVTSTSAKIVVRYPYLPANESAVQLLWRKAQADSTTISNPAWADGPVLAVAEESDWTVTAHVRGLWPDSDYEYVLAYTNKTHLSYPSSPIRFRTFPDPKILAGSRFRFLASSCLIPNFPWVPLQGRSIKGFDYMADYLFAQEKLAAPGLVTPALVAQENGDLYNVTRDPVVNDSSIPAGLTDEVTVPPPRTEFLLFLGDFIYADVPWYFGDNLEEYRRMYRRVYNSPSFRRVYEKLPMLHVYDDHEIINNYEGKANDTAPFRNATNPFKIYQADANHEAIEKDQYYYEFRFGDIAYFVMDTRRYRSGVSEDVATRTMLGDSQLTALYRWLGNVNNTATFKFIVSSVPFTSLWSGDAQLDSWAGYTSEKAALLEVLHTVPNVFIISGDRHEFATIEFNGPAPNSYPVYEISTSPLNQFYIPFIRTLRQQSDNIVKRTHKFAVPTDAKDELRFDEIEIEVPQERTLKYIATGNHKWATFDIDTTNSQQPLLQLDVMIEGKSAYQHTFQGVPVKLKSSSSAISAVTDGLKDIFGRVGISPDKWF